MWGGRRRNEARFGSDPEKAGRVQGTSNSGLALVLLPLEDIRRRFKRDSGFLLRIVLLVASLEVVTIEGAMRAPNLSDGVGRAWRFVVYAVGGSLVGWRGKVGEEVGEVLELERLRARTLN